MCAPGKKAVISPSQLWTLKAVIMAWMDRYAHWYNGDIIIMGLTNYFMVVFKVEPTNWNPYQASSCGPSIWLEITGPKERTIILLYEHSIKPNPNDLALFPYIIASIRLYQRSFCLR